ncbi:non-hydrolyzing UDP-N-acetylglucosamine 2-epimerase [Chitinivibrio alkaliphilus]|uniref:UDP-N-acetylglucosamine 2-epimerase (non-hydrolyzing) n=1 Tax=Chitinivibrio alkaliphilus ACht1 TaxID=1313304 RepID=U7D635_9BACT|nr:UDP-N-acetylglucosamine 2-epimerase (non-hydrolyzing) [Chitinivibrio alkaliphilus]ERP31398.1 UDP-N-acetylglucosamine 2-epimerase [Chitinivibrio alkaliphilus ACht1]
MRVLFVYGTRPEAIKMAPLVRAFQEEPAFEVRVCVTGQHREMLDQVLSFFEITPEYDLNLMKPNQTLFSLTADVLTGLEPIIDSFKPELLWVQGDTTTVMAGSLAGFYKQIPVAHLEAGLRSGNRFSPFPEEINRKVTGHIADYHFAPTARAVENLAAEGISQKVWQVGNTVTDALLLGLNIISERGESPYEQAFAEMGVDFSKRVILVTGHRRESFGGAFEQMCSAMKEIAQTYADVQLVYPVHLNPNVRTVVQEVLSGLSNVILIDPLDYPSLIWLMNRSFMVLTDSGGIQEEAPTLGKPVLVMRDVTERQEGVEAGTAKLVGTSKEVILREACALLDSTEAYTKMANAVNPYGDGTTSSQIVRIVKKELLSPDRTTPPATE